MNILTAEIELEEDGTHWTVYAEADTGGSWTVKEITRGDGLKGVPNRFSRRVESALRKLS